MEGTGQWVKISGATPIFIPYRKTFETGMRRPLNLNTQLTWPPDPYLSFLPRYPSNAHVGPRKRPSTDTTLPAGGKRPFLIKESNPVPTLNGKRKRYLDDISKNIALQKEDKRASKRLVDNILKATMPRLAVYSGCQIYRQQYFDAGSYPVKMKISKADEFDVNIPLNVTAKNVRTDGKVNYCFNNVGQYGYRVSSLMDDKQLVYDDIGTAIPSGYAVVDVDMQQNKPFYQYRLLGRSLPSKFLHSNLRRPRQNYYHRYASVRDRMLLLAAKTMTGSNRSVRMHGCVELIPLDVMKDLFEKMRSALCMIYCISDQNVTISRKRNGPALKMTIKPGRCSVIKHDINVDIAVSLHCDLPLTAFGWPREETRRAFSKETINEVLKAGVHLVPKKDLFWAISFSKAERALLSRLDTDQGCRKYVTKIMKKYVMTCSSQSSNGLPGISSHIIKTQILWSCEKHHNYPNYWHSENRDLCMINTMKELGNTLTSKSLLDYFNPTVNILEEKDTAVLSTLAQFIDRRRNELENMK